MRPRPTRSALRATAASLSLVTSLSLLPASAAAASTCPDPGGETVGFRAAADGDVVFATAGEGHGVGMSQMAAIGAAEGGCTAEEILDVSYPGTTVGTMPPLDEVRVGLGRARETSLVKATGGDVVWATACDTRVSCDGRTFGVTRTQLEGSTWRVTAASDGSFIVTDESDGSVMWEVGDPYTLLEARHDGTVIDVTAFGTDGVEALSVAAKWGYTRFDTEGETGAVLHTVQVVTGDGDDSAVERYLRGLREMESSRPTEALEAQAIAARTFLRRRASESRANSARFDLAGNESGQVYGGWAHETEDAAQGGRWAAAVAETRDQVLRHDEQVIDARYAKSHGGHSDALTVSEGSTDHPYLAAVDVSAWEIAAQGLVLGAVGFSYADLATRFDLVSVSDVEVVATSTGGRPARTDGNGDGHPDGLRVTGTDAAGQPATVWLSGAEVRAELGLESARFVLAERATGRTAASIALACPDGRVPEDGFTDVPEASAHEGSVDCIHWWDIASGTSATTYAPDRSVERGQMATYIANTLRAAGVALPQDAPDAFSDDEGSVHAANIDALAALDLVSGVGDGRFAPSGEVTRAQMATFLRKAYQHVSATLLPEGTGSFSDDAGSVHEASIDALATAHITTGIGDGKYGPSREVTREQMASFIARLLDVLVERGEATTPA